MNINDGLHFEHFYGGNFGLSLDSQHNFIKSKTQIQSSISCDLGLIRKTKKQDNKTGT